MILTDHERKLVRDALAAIADAVSYADTTDLDVADARDRVQSWNEAHDELAAAAGITRAELLGIMRKEQS